MAVSRVGWALGLSAVTFVALFAATGAAFADRETTPMSGTFQAAPSQPGDKATYSLGMVMADGEKGNWVSTGAEMSVERFADRILPGPVGQPRLVQSFLTSWTLGGVPVGNDFDFDDFEISAGPGFEVASDDWLVAHPDAATGEVVAVTVAPGSPRLDGTLAGDRFEEEADLLVSDAVTLWEPGPAPCGFRSPLQDGWDLSKPVSVPGECPPGGEVGGAPPPKGRKFLAFAEDRVQEWDATVFASTEDRDAVRLWFSEEVPYPVRMLVRFDLGVPTQYQHGPTRIYLLYEMVEFHAGREQAAPALPTWTPAMAPRQPFGADEAGVDHPFPLSQALQAARQDPFNPDVRDFFAEHPQAFVASASYAEVEEGLRWTMTIAGGGEGLEARVTYDPSVQPSPSPVPLPIEQASQTSTDTSSASGPFVNAADAPPSFPKVAAVMDRWRLVRDPAIPAGSELAWSHGIACAGEECDEADAWLAAGTADPSNGRYSFLGLRPDGSLRFLQESPSPYPVPRSEDDDFYDFMDWSAYSDSWDDDPRDLSFAYAGAWVFPKPATTGAVGGAALLAGLLYFAWPLLKGTGAIGLFSRIDKDDLLDHPLRADIVQVVGSQPGIHFQELVRRLDKGRGTMEHHLRKLVDGGLIVPQTSSGFTCYFPKGKVDRSVMAAAPVLKSDGARVVLQTIHDNPGIAAQDVAERTGLTPSTVNYHLKRLTQVGLANGQRNGRFLVLTPTMLGQQALGTWGRT